MSYNRMFIDICGFCNAKCEYCQSGLETKYAKKVVPKYVDFDEFKKTVLYLKDKQIVAKGFSISLFNWGEPFLHPQIKEILRFLKQENINTVLSSNFSKKIMFEPGTDDLSNVAGINISLPGFSQQSYDKIHQFNFDTVKQNIKDTINSMRLCGFEGGVGITFHIYQYNLHEYNSALDFAIENKLSCTPAYAYIADSERHKRYLTNNMPIEEMKQIGQDLIYHPDMRGG